MKLNRELLVRAYAVWLIVEGKVERALEVLSKYYGVSTPNIKVGLPKGYSRTLGCYISKKATLYVRSSSELRNPYVILHEYYHHLRCVLGEHRGTERYANEYAKKSIEALVKLVRSGVKLNAIMQQDDNVKV